MKTSKNQGIFLALFLAVCLLLTACVGPSPDHSGPPGTSQETSQEAPGTSQEPPESSQEPPESSQEPPETSQEIPAEDTPLGVIFLLDVSGSMFWGIDASGKTYLDLTVEAVTACLQYSMRIQDYCGIIAMGDPAIEVSPMLPVPQMARIIASMNNLEMSMTGTPYAVSVEAAGSALMALSSVEKRHIVIISDGEPTDEGGYETYSQSIGRYAQLGVTVTIVNVGSGGYDTDMERAAALGNGRYVKTNDIRELTDRLHDELNRLRDE